ncbi:LacI family DNA-binding transcriptional regulator [Massilia sp. TS11]|uniref:LacI family DNA-binding transcriptional regulator n=1 Tax=Massilia sp. TS11 TaxID=2908003 RepID=UPI001EDC2096|nr:LacI family DNA-binding transcriptional regulator [Massilia sp. TS11]MCG2585797.1 LacI family transcriptional regulator [Massilia sp. TS11]
MNLKSLARDLGISKTTVSRALNGYPEVNALTRERVLAAAKAVGYEANPMARSLAVGRSNTLGLIFPIGACGSDAMFHAIVGGMARALEADRKTLFMQPVSAAQELGAYEQMVRGRRVDGLVVCRPRVDDARIALLQEKNFPFIAFGRSEARPGYAWFDYDDVAGVRLAAEHLLGHGHRRIAMLSGPEELHCVRQRRAGLLEALAAAGLQADPRHLHGGLSDRRGGYQATQALLALSERPSAIIVDNHLAGAGCVQALHDAGLALGKDMSVVVWGQLEDSLCRTELTTVSEPKGEWVGETVISMLNARVKGTPAEELQTLWQPALMVGASTGPCPS